MITPSANTNRLPLPGLDGANPLAFLAALGTLRVLALGWMHDEVRLGWQSTGASWQPVVAASRALSEDEIVSTLHAQLSAMAGHPAFTFAENLKIKARTFAPFVRIAFADWHDRKDTIAAEFAAAYACELVVNEDGTIQDTAFRTMSGAGHQHFLAFMEQLARSTTPLHLRAALFAPWHYEEQKLSMRWDPTDDRRYALRWSNPSGDVIRTVRGANRLAIEALPLFPVAPVGRNLETTGFGSPTGRGVFWTWPIWEAPLPLDSVRSVLALAELQAARPDRRKLAARGVVEVFRCERITIGKFRNFTPAQPV